ncbi:hypothetical protein KIN20_006418, partial [Parelaphostrongylus tenuis]
TRRDDDFSPSQSLVIEKSPTLNFGSLCCGGSPEDDNKSLKGGDGDSITTRFRSCFGYTTSTQQTDRQFMRRRRLRTEHLSVDEVVTSLSKKKCLPVEESSIAEEASLVKLRERLNSRVDIGVIREPKHDLNISEQYNLAH